jgi:hypothetical protein
MAKGNRLREQDSVMLSVMYRNPETDSPATEQFAFNLGEIAKNGSKMVKKGRLVMSFIDGLADTVRSEPVRWDPRLGGWVDSHASAQCQRGQSSLADQARWFSNDVEVERVVGLWDQYCSRYESLRKPMRRNPPTGADVWPSAKR